MSVPEARLSVLTMPPFCEKHKRYYTYRLLSRTHVCEECERAEAPPMEDYEGFLATADAIRTMGKRNEGVLSSHDVDVIRQWLRSPITRRNAFPSLLNYFRARLT